MKSKQDQKSRLDRIEKALENLLQGTAELKESQKKTDEQLRMTDDQLNRTIKKLDEIGRQLGDIGLVQGEAAEDLFFRNVRHLFKEDRDMIFADVKRNLKKKGVACIFRSIPDTHSDSFRTVIPIHSGHPFRFISDTHSNRIRTALLGYLDYQI